MALRWRQISKRNYTYEKITLTGNDFERQLIEHLQGRTYSAILGIGGDGTHHSLINTILTIKKRYPGMTMPAYAFCPCGTGNDIAKSIGLKVGVEHYGQVIETAVNGRLTLCDVGSSMDKYFIDMISFGIDCKILNHRDKFICERLKKKPASVVYGYWAYIKAIIKGLITLEQIDGEIRVDGHLFYKGKFANLIINNCRIHAGHFDITPAAAFDDGKLDALFVKGRWAYFWEHLKAFRKNPSIPRKGHSVEGNRIQGTIFSLTLNNEVIIQMDGEIIEPRKAFTITCLPQFLCIKVPGCDSK